MFKKVFAGMQVIAKYETAEKPIQMCAYHDTICIMIPENISDEDRQVMLDLGWNDQENPGSFTRFV